MASPELVRHAFALLCPPWVHFGRVSKPCAPCVWLVSATIRLVSASIESALGPRPGMCPPCVRHVSLLSVRALCPACVRLASVDKPCPPPVCLELPLNASKPCPPCFPPVFVLSPLWQGLQILTTMRPPFVRFASVLSPLWPRL